MPNRPAIVCEGDEEMEEVVEHTADGQAATESKHRQVIVSILGPV